jgi:hypothetical protein
VQITGVGAEIAGICVPDRRSGLEAGSRGHALVFDGCSRNNEAVSDYNR